MKQLNLNVTAEFERDLRLVMKQRRIAKKSDAVRIAVHEAAAHGHADADFNYQAWLGEGLKSPLNPRPRFRGEDDLWS